MLFLFIPSIQLQPSVALRLFMSSQPRRLLDRHASKFWLCFVFLPVFVLTWMFGGQVG